MVVYSTMSYVRSKKLLVLYIVKACMQVEKQIAHMTSGSRLHRHNTIFHFMLSGISEADVNGVAEYVARVRLNGWDPL